MKNLEFCNIAGGELRFRNFADFFTEKGFSDRGFVGDNVLIGVCFGGTDNGKSGFLFKILVINLYGCAKGNFVGAKLVFVKDNNIFKHYFKVGNACFNNGLLVFCFIIFAVFRKVAKGTGNTNFIGNLLAANGFKLNKLIFQCFKTAFGNNYLFSI